MANRCPECNKFVSCDYEIEMANDPDVSELKDELEIAATFTINKVCAECGTTLATKDVETIDHTDKQDFEEV